LFGPVFNTLGRDEMLADARRAGIAVMRLSGLALPMGT
jgi:hypothetical protein